MADISAPFPNFLPMTGIRNLKMMVLGKLGEFHITCGLVKSGSKLLVINIGESLEKE